MIKAKNTVDLDEMSVEDLMALIQSAESKRREKIGQARQELIEEMKAKAEKLGLSLGDLIERPEVHRKAAAGARSKAVVKFRGPQGEPWSGRGKKPNWLTALEATGRDKAEFLVEP